MQRNEFSIRIRNLIISLLTFAALMLYASTFSEPVLRISVTPDDSPMVLRRKLKPLTDYLEKKAGMKFEFRPVADGDALLDALVGNKLDLAWIDGAHFIQAKTRSHDQVMPLVQRAEDQQTTSVFITTHADITRLEDLQDKTLSFGAKSSASGYLMPRSFLIAAHLDPDRGMQPIISGSPDETVAAVSKGKADAGVLGRESWEKQIEQGKVDQKMVHVFYTTPAYHDYSWAVRNDMDVNLRQKLTDAFLALNQHNGLDKEILDFQRASKFIPARTENYAAIEAAARSAGLLKEK